MTHSHTVISRTVHMVLLLSLQGCQKEGNGSRGNLNKCGLKNPSLTFFYQHLFRGSVSDAIWKLDSSTKKKKNVLPWLRWDLRTKSLWSQGIGTSGRVPVDTIIEDEAQSCSSRTKSINQKDLWKTGPWEWAPGIRTTFWCWQILTWNGRNQRINDVRWWSFLKTLAVKLSVKYTQQDIFSLEWQLLQHSNLFLFKFLWGCVLLPNIKIPLQVKMDSPPTSHYVQYFPKMP